MLMRLSKKCQMSQVIKNSVLFIFCKLRGKIIQIEELGKRNRKHIPIGFYSKEKRSLTQNLTITTCPFNVCKKILRSIQTSLEINSRHLSVATLLPTGKDRLLNSQEFHNLSIKSLVL